MLNKGFILVNGSNGNACTQFLKFIQDKPARYWTGMDNFQFLKVEGGSGRKRKSGRREAEGAKKGNSADAEGGREPIQVIIRS